MTVDIVCPLYNADTLIGGLLDALEAQKGIEIGQAVFPITVTETAEATASIIKERGYTSFFVEKADFSHSLTREKAVFDYCTADTVVMMSQDIFFEAEDAVYHLAKTVSEETVYAYGRQICKKKTIEHYVRQKNYGEASLTVTKDDIERLQLRAFFASDAFSAYHRETFVSLGGYGGIPMMMNEDMYYSKKILEAGYKKAYAADAVVEHSHKFTLRQLYDRYYATGVWFSEHAEFDGYKTTDSGMKLALYVLKEALKHFNIPVLFRFLPDMTARYLGMRNGKKNKKAK